MGAITTVSGTLMLMDLATVEFPELATQGGAISASNASTFLAPNLLIMLQLLLLQLQLLLLRVFRVLQLTNGISYN